MSDERTSIIRAINAMAGYGAKTDADWQQLAYRVQAHYAEHGDNGLITRLYLAVPSSCKKASLKNWLVCFCGVVVNKDKATRGSQPFVKDRSREVDIEGGRKESWYSAKPFKDPNAIVEPYDFAKAFVGLMKAADKAVGLKNATPGLINSLAEQLGIAMRVGDYSAEHFAAIDQGLRIKAEIEAIKRGEAIPGDAAPELSVVAAVEDEAEVEVETGDDEWVESGVDAAIPF